MLPGRIAESLTARIFLMTATILLCAGAVAFGFIAWATPSTYTSVRNDDLSSQVDALVEKLADSTPEACGALLDQFVLTSGANVTLMGPDGRLVDTGAKLTSQAIYEEDNWIVTPSEGDSIITYGTADVQTESVMTFTTSGQDTITTQVHFAGQSEGYTLYVTSRLESENLAVRALTQMAPWLLLVLLAFSLLCAFFYSRYITRPIVRMSNIAAKMAELDFHWTCGERRRDEIGKLSRSLDQMAGRLRTALSGLSAANEALKKEMERERGLERSRMEFFFAASHELKTPLAVIQNDAAMLKSPALSEEDRIAYAQQIFDTTRQLSALITNILKLNKLENQQIFIERSTYLLNEQLCGCLLQFEELLEQNGFYRHLYESQFSQ